MYRKISAILISTVIAVGIIVFMLYSVRDELATAIEHIVWGYLLIATVICLSAWFLRGLRYKVILRGIGISCGLLFSTGCIFVSQTANLIVPARLGDLVRVFILRHEYQASISQGISSLVVERVFDIVMVAVLGAVSLLFVFNVPDWFYSIILIPLGLGVVFYIILIYSGRLTSEHRYIRILLTILEQIRQVSLSFRSVASISIQSIVIWILDILVCFFVALMFQVTIPFAVIVLAIVIGNLVKAIPLTPGGVGTYELSVALTFTVAGIDPAVATLIAVIDHLVKNLVTLAGGIVSIYFFGDWVLDTIRSAFRREMYGGGEPGV
jgi:uncharacterized membrane protein YbhN (UPF0104 family)